MDTEIVQPMRALGPARCVLSSQIRPTVTKKTHHTVRDTGDRTARRKTGIIDSALRTTVSGRKPTAARIFEVHRRTVLVIGLTVGCLALPPQARQAGAQGQSSPALPTTPLTLPRLVDPATRVEVNGKPVQVALHGLIRFDSLADVFTYIDDQAGRWTFASAQERQAFGDALLQRAVESRIVSMQTELPLEVVLTHTRGEVGAAVDKRYTAEKTVFSGRHWQASVAT